MPLPARDRKIKKRTGFGSHPERLFVGCLKRRSSDCYDRKIKKRTGFGSHPERTKPNLSTIFPGGMSGVLNLRSGYAAIITRGQSLLPQTKLAANRCQCHLILAPPLAVESRPYRDQSHSGPDGGTADSSSVD